MTLAQFVSVTKGSTQAAVRAAMVHAIADLGLGMALQGPDYHRFYHAVLARLAARSSRG